MNRNASAEYQQNLLELILLSYLIVLILSLIDIWLR